MPKKRYFLDANVIISGLLWEGNERRVLELGEEEKLHLITSQYVLKEVIDVLSEFEFTKDRIIEFIVYLESFVEMIETTKKDVMKYWDKLDDKGDVPVLAAAVKSKSILITGDKKLKRQASNILSIKNASELLNTI